MPETDDQAARMENGEAGITVSPASTTLSEKVSHISPLSPASSSRPLVLAYWSGLSRLQNAYTGIKSALGKIKDRTSHSQEEADPPIVRQLKNSTRGYPSLATFLDSDEGFMIYRRFGFLQSRLLLEKQDELRELEEDLDNLDRREAEDDVVNPMTRNLSDEIFESRQQLLSKIEAKFYSYANLLDVSRKMVAMNRPAKGDYQSVRNFMDNRKPLTEGEDSWVDYEEDIVTLRGGREHAMLDLAIEKLLKWFHCSPLERIFGDERSKMKTTDLEIYYSRERIARLATLIITAVILVLLIVPIYTLYHLVNEVSNSRAYAICIGILVVFTLAFSAVLSLFTKAKRHEILAAAAAYCAVLVVFLGNVGPNNRPSP